MRRAAWSALALAAIGAAWLLLFPVPLGWAVRLGLSRALPASEPLRVTVDAATFRWRWGDSAIALELRGVEAHALGRPLLQWRELIVEVPKAGLWRQQFAPSRITLREPFVTIDQTPEGALALLARPSTAKPAPSAPPDLAPLAPVLPAPGAATVLEIEGARVRVRNAAGEMRLPFGFIRSTLACGADGTLALDLDVPFATDTAAPRLKARASLDAVTRRGDFSLGLPAFSTTTLPVVPGAPPLPFRGMVALDAAGRFDLAALRADEVTGGILVIDAEVAPPTDLGLEKIRIDRLEVRGRLDARAERIVLETARVRMGSLALELAEFDAALGDRPQARWRLEIAGLKGAELRALLGKTQRARVPLADEAIDALGVERLTLRGSAEVARDAAGAWSAQAMQLDGRAEILLGREPLACTWTAAQAKEGGDIALEFSLPGFTPSRWPVALIGGTPAGAIDMPLALSAQATVSAAGEPRSVRLGLTAGAGTVRTLRPGLPPVAVRRLEVRAESEKIERAWRLPVARLELANGAVFDLSGLGVERTPTALAAEGDVMIKKLTGEFIASWLPPDAWSPLTALRLPPREVSLDGITAHFKVAAKANAAGAWQPSAVAADLKTQARIHAAQLNLGTKLSLPDGGSAFDVTMTLADFRPSQLGIVVSEDLASDGLDFPVSFSATARAGLDGTLANATVQLRAGAGRLKTPPTLGGIDLPMQEFAIDARYDPAAQRAEVKALRLEAGGLRFDLADVTTTIAPPHVASGRLAIAPFALRPLLALWPEKVQPDLRRTVDVALRGGEFAGAHFDWAVKFDPAAQPALTVSKLNGDARLASLEVAHASVPGPVTIAGVTVAVDYPRATVALQDVVVPGLRVGAAQLQASGLDRPVPAATFTGKFESDLAAANRAWKFSAEELARGTLSGEITGAAPFDLSHASARVALDLARMQVKLPAFASATPDTVSVEVRVANPLAADQTVKADFALETSAWLGAPVKLAGRAALRARDHQPETIELLNYEHGRTRLQAIFRQPDATHREISVSGSYLNLGPLLRAGLAAADAMAARPVAPAPTAAAATPSGPATALKVDASIGEIEFGPGRNARAFELHTRLVGDWPAEFSVSSVAGVNVGLKASLTGPVDRQKFTFSIDDASDWMRTLAAPWADAPPAAGQFGALVIQLAKVPTVVSGGAVTFEADLQRGEPEWLRGSLRLRRATLIRAPYALQMLALKSGRSLQDSPMIEEFSIGRLTLSRTALAVTDTALAGSGLIDRLKLKSASYALADEALKVDGEYFGVGFDIIGTRADPKIFLKDSNPLIRAVGTRNEFDFDLPAPAPKPAGPSR